MEVNKPEPCDRLSGISLVRAILGNLHESLKWLWLIVMGLAVVNAIEVYANLLDPGMIQNPFDIVDMFLTKHTVVFLSFIFVFIRFYFGDSRFLDLSYEETHFYRGLQNELGKYSGKKRLLDILLLLNHGIFFYFMSFQIGDAEKYIYFFVVLMTVNVVWLLLQVFVNAGVRYQDQDPLIGNLRGNQHLLIWIINNFIFVFLILYIIFSEWDQRILVALLLTFMNSFIDFYTTWKFYFPPLRELVARTNNATEDKNMV